MLQNGSILTELFASLRFEESSYVFISDSVCTLSVLPRLKFESRLLVQVFVYRDLFYREGQKWRITGTSTYRTREQSYLTLDAHQIASTDANA